MKVISSETVAFVDVQADGASRCRIRELITDRDGAPTFAMRQFQIEPGGQTPFHRHPWEHEVFILEGCGYVRGEEGPRPFQAQDAIFIAPDELHSFVNSGETPLRLLCLIPVAQQCCR